jgi:hypothetical protein
MPRPRRRKLPLQFGGRQRPHGCQPRQMALLWLAQDRSPQTRAVGEEARGGEERVRRSGGVGSPPGPLREEATAGLVQNMASTPFSPCCAAHRKALALYLSFLSRTLSISARLFSS